MENEKQNPITFREAKDGQLLALIEILCSLVTSWKAKRPLGTMADSLMLALEDISRGYRIMLKRYAKYEVKQPKGGSMYDESLMDEDTQNQFNADVKDWDEKVICSIPFLTFTLSEKKAEEKDLTARQSVLLDRYFDIKWVP